MSRISPGTAIVGIFAVLFGLVGAYAIRKSLETKPVAEAPAPQLNMVPVASIDLEPGRPLTFGDVAVLRLTDAQMRERNLPEGYMTIPQQIIGRTLREAVPKGSTFMTANFYPQGLGPTVADRLKPGFRAVTVPIANTGAVSGFASPGSLVDVIFRTSETATEDLPQTTITLLESVEVLALGQSLIAGSTEAVQLRGNTTVTLAVSPQQAAALKVVEGRGDLMLAVRNPSDAEYVSDPEPQTLESLLGFAQGTPPVTTEIYRGNAKETMSFEGGQGLPPRITGLPVRPRTRQTSAPISGGNVEEPGLVPPPASVPPEASTQVVPPAATREVPEPSPAPSPAVEASTPVSQTPDSPSVPLGARIRPVRELPASRHSRAPEAHFRIESPAAVEQLAQRPEAPLTTVPAAKAQASPTAVKTDAPPREPAAVKPDVSAAPAPAGDPLAAEGQAGISAQSVVAAAPANSDTTAVTRTAPPSLEQPENAPSREEDVVPQETSTSDVALADSGSRASSFVTEVFTGTSKQRVTFRNGRRLTEPVAQSARADSSEDSTRSLILDRN